MLILLTNLDSGQCVISVYIVGRGQGVKSPLTIGLSEWSDIPKLGPIGETLIEFTAHVSVLLLQQCAYGDKAKINRQTK